MIKKILAFAGLLTAPFCLSAQYGLGDAIYLGPNDIPSLVGQVGHWGSTHGSPAYSPTEFFMWYSSYTHEGEGVFRRFNFLPNTEYDIYIGIISSQSDPAYNQNGFKVLLANNVVAAGSPFSGTAIPTFSSSRQLYSYTGPNFSDKTLRLKFRTYNQGYENIVLYPVTTTTNTTCDLTIDCITISSCPINGDHYYYNAVIPPGTTGTTNVFIGSSYGNTASLTSSNPSQITDITAANKIELRHNTNLSVDGEHTITLQVSYSDCSPIFPLNVPFESVQHEFRDRACDYTKPGRDNNGRRSVFRPDINQYPQRRDMAFTVTPNPTSGRFRISFQQAPEAAEVSITSIDGRIVKREKIAGKQQTEIDISSAPNGIYFVRITDGTRVDVQKITKQQ